MHSTEVRAAVGLRKVNLNFPHYACSFGLSSAGGQKLWFHLKHNPASSPGETEKNHSATSVRKADLRAQDLISDFQNMKQ